EPAAIASPPEVPPSVEASAVLAETMTKMTLREAIKAAAATEPAPIVEAAAHAEPAVVAEPIAEAATTATPAYSAPTSKAPEPAFAREAFRFGPEPAPDPAAFLLAPPRQREAPAPASPAAEKPEAAQPPETAEATPVPHDPLRALKALSENEKI